jgi:integrase
VDAFRESLRTEDRADAIAQAHKLIAEYHERFASIRDQHRPRLTQLTPKLVAHLRDQIKHELLDGDDIRGVIGVAVEAIPFDIRGELRQKLGESMGDELTDAELLRFWADSLKQAHAQGAYGLTQGFVNMILGGMGLPPADWTQQAAALAVLGRTLAGAYEAIAQRAEGELIETPDAPVPYIPEAPARPEAPSTPAKTLRSVVPDWKRLNASKLNAAQRMDKALDLWEEAVGVVALEQITKATGGKFVLFLLDREARKFGNKTAANHASNINALMNVAAKFGHIETNPLDLSLPKTGSEKRTPWTLDELKLLHGTPVTGEQPEGVDPADADLVISMLLWSGARLGEIAGLRVQDIQERDGVLAAYIRRETTKEDTSVRWLPIASAIRERVAAHAKRRKDEGHLSLFPTFNRPIKVSATDQAGRWFLAYRQHLKLPAGPLDGSHKWRHTVRTKLAGEGLGEALLDAVTGHQAAGGSAGRKNYTHTNLIPLAKVLEAIEQLAWPWPSRA